MSTVMYAFRIRRKLFWEIAPAIRDFYLQNNMVSSVANETKKRLIEGTAPRSVLGSWVLFCDYLLYGTKPYHWSENEVELQLFTRGSDYIIRVLERGWMFWNVFEEQGWPVTPVSYDGRSESSKEKPQEYKMALWMEDKIKAHSYVVWPVINRDDLWAAMYDDELFAEIRKINLLADEELISKRDMVKSSNADKEIRLKQLLEDAIGNIDRIALGVPQPLDNGEFHNTMMDIREGMRTGIDNIYST